MHSRMERELRACGRQIERRPDYAVWEFTLPAGFVGFQGHFPGHPVLPAIVQIMMGRMVAEAALAAGRRGLRLAGVRRAKFLAPAGPGQPLRVECSLAEEGGGWVAKVQAHCGQARVASLSLVLAEPLETA